MLTKHAFSLLRYLAKHSTFKTQRKLAQDLEVSLGTLNSALKSLEEQGFVQDGHITPQGLQALEPYKVDNAIILAAGLSSRFAPISYEKPKGVLIVRGEVLIERQIRQLQEAGISEIYVVVGYKKEQFFYLEKKFGVHIVVNPHYLTHNNNSSLYMVKDKLKNTYICSSDDYFCQNPFSLYEFEAYYSSVFVEGKTDEWCLKLDRKNRIKSVTIGGSDSWIMLGHVYFDRAFSDTLRASLEKNFDQPKTKDMLWEELFLQDISQYSMVAKKFEDGCIFEFDNLDEVRLFDPHFIQNVDTDIFSNIQSVLGCEIDDIHDFYPLKQGLTNLSCHFSVGSDEYVYRHPGVGTEKLIDRKSEKQALELALKLGLDTTYIYEDEDLGWKISRFIPNATCLDVSDPSQLKHAMQMCATLHQTSVTLDRTFDFVQESLSYESHLKDLHALSVPGLRDMKQNVLKLKQYADADGYKQCLSHNDFFNYNLLLDEHNNINLIDWEYAGMSDEASDFGTFCVCCELSFDQIKQALEYYLNHAPSNEELRHFLAYVVFAGWCWYLWALEKEAYGENVSAWMYVYYRYVQEYLDYTLSLYEEPKDQSALQLQKN